MSLLIVLLLTEILSLVVLHQHFFRISKLKYYISLVIHVILSLWLWILYFELAGYHSFYDNPRHVWLLLNLTGMICAVVVPRIILILFHFSGKLARLKSKGHVRWITNTGYSIMVIIITIIALSTFIGRFNFKTDQITIKIKDLNKDLDGLKIAQISDLHLAGFYHHAKALRKAIDKVNRLNADIIFNTGDFITFGWREFDRNDTILSKAKSRYGNFAVLGNHDFGTYQPFFTDADKDNNELIMNKLIKSSGYKVLNNEYTKLRIGNAKIGLIGVKTKGRYPNMIHGDVRDAIGNLDSVDLKILLSHDPNQWEEEVTGVTDIDITLSGHTHGMQMGILTKKFRWSPSKYFYPHWNGLYTEGRQFQYVNRGLGVLSIPFRIWMPPEITLITLSRE
jgi:uncharacterized protein